jgi:hypothetical protein
MRTRFYHIVFFALTAAAGCRQAERFPPGGYPYPEKVADKDTNFYYYPVRNMESRRDSFRDALSYRFYRAFDEPNISLRPQPEPVFRFVYSGVFGPSVIIVLRPGEIIVKKGYASQISGTDSSKLTPLEQSHSDLLDRYYPIEEVRPTWSAEYTARYRRRMDSLGRVYPQLHDVRYYWYLAEKNYVPPKNPFSYSLQKIEISPRKYDSLVHLINTSKYWRMPYRVECQDPPFDGYSYILEANTLAQYNTVTSGSCSDPDTTKFPQVCEALIVAAGMNKEIGIAWDGQSDTIQKPPPIVVQDVHLEQVVEQKSRKHKKHS